MFILCLTHLSHIVIREINSYQRRLLADQLHEQPGDALADAAATHIKLSNGHHLQCIKNGSSTVALYGIQSQHKLLQGHSGQSAAQYICTFLGWKEVMNT